MALSVIRLGSPRAKREKLRIGAVRRPPRGVKKKDYARRGFYDLWLPELAPSAKWVSWATAQPLTGVRWKKFERNYRREMQDRQHLVALLALLSRELDFAVGCYCEDESRCHRSILKKLLRAEGAKLG